MDDAHHSLAFSISARAQCFSAAGWLPDGYLFGNRDSGALAAAFDRLDRNGQYEVHSWVSSIHRIRMANYNLSELRQKLLLLEAGPHLLLHIFYPTMDLIDKRLDLWDQELKSLLSLLKVLRLHLH